MKNITRLAIVSVVLACLLFVAKLIYFANSEGPSAGLVSIQISPGSDVKPILKVLEKNSVIASESTLYWYLRIFCRSCTLKAGEYEFTTPITPKQVIDILTTGRQKAYAVTIPEGANLKEIVKLIAVSGVCDEKTLEAVIFSENTKQRFNLPNVQKLTVEGYLFPETYHFSKSDCGPKIIYKMHDELHEKISDRMLEQLRAANYSLHEVLTLASIVEKETADPSERARIAGVYHNRLKKKMKLQADPTVIYGLKNYRGDIRYRDLKNPHAFNTYVHKGLPPGPIASPGLASIEAVLWPESHDYLYFVAKDDGSHVFCTNYRCHNAAVKKWQMRR